MSIGSRIWVTFEKVTRCILLRLFTLLRIKLTDNRLDQIMQFVKFCFVGVSNTMLSLIIYYIFILFSKQLYLVGNVVGFLISVINSYYWNSKFVFKQVQEQPSKILLKTFLAYGVTLFLGTGLLYILVKVLDVSEFIAPIINLLITIPINYVLNKFWAYKDK